jgi:hypothetical protein
MANNLEIWGLELQELQSDDEMDDLFDSKYLNDLEL